MGSLALSFNSLAPRQSCTSRSLDRALKSDTREVQQASPTISERWRHLELVSDCVSWDGPDATWSAHLDSARAPSHRDEILAATKVFGGPVVTRFAEAVSEGD